MTVPHPNDTVHPVQSQWHYELMTKHGFVAETKQAVGFVRRYKYVHPNGRTVTVTTGASRDYWESSTSPGGLWSTLEPWLNTLS